MNHVSLPLLRDESPPVPHERGELLSKIGQFELLKTGNFQTARRLFGESLALCPHDWKLIYDQGLSLLEFAARKEHRQALHLAHKRFKAASILAPEQAELWESWGYCLAALGAVANDVRYLQEALEKLERALELGAPAEEIHWERGRIHFRLAERSGEALDMQLAVDAYQEAVRTKPSFPAEFWVDFGVAYLRLSAQINEVRYSVKAIACFKHAVFLHKESALAWKCLAYAFVQLYSATQDEDHFAQANEAFAAAAERQPRDALLWYQWAHFCSDSARRTLDIKKLRACIDKCHRVLTLHPKWAKASALLAENLSMLGKAIDRVDLIVEAENRMARLVEDDAYDPEIWHAYGHVATMLGEYHQDMDFFYEAIERFQEGLSLDRTQHRLWHAMACSYNTIGEKEGSPEEYERALRFYRKAIDLYPSTHYLIDYAIALAKYAELVHDKNAAEQACAYFERVLAKQKNAVYLHPEWLFFYGCALHTHGEFYDDDTIYARAIDCFTHVLMIDPDFSAAHHRIALALAHVGDVNEELPCFQRALHHVRLAAKQDEENDHLLCDWAMILMQIAQRTIDPAHAEQLWRDAEHKLTCAIRLGNASAYYTLGCLHALLGCHDSAMFMLEKAEKFRGLPALDEMAEDEWLDNIRHFPLFQDFLQRVGQRQHNQ